MTLDEHEINRHPPLARALALQQAGQFEEASHLLADQDPYFYDQVEIKVLYGVLSHFPQATSNPLPAQSYLQALFARRMGQFQQANHLLTTAKAAYAATQQAQGVIYCTLELARLAHQQGQQSRAHHYLVHELQPLLATQFPKASNLHAHCTLQLADSWLAQGELSLAQRAAEQALAVYIEHGDAYGQVRAALWLANRALNRGDYTTVRQHLSRARQQRELTALGVLAEAAILHGELRFTWYQRRLEEAMRIAQTYLGVADAEPYSSDRLEARLFLGNLYRELRQYRTATSWYAETQTLVEQLGYPTYAERLQAEWAWLSIMEGQLATARTQLHTPIPPRPEEEKHDNQQPGGHRQSSTAPCCSQTPIPWWTVQAVLHLLEREWVVADKLLNEAAAYYENQGEWLALCAVRLYRGYSALQQADMVTLLQQLGLALQWLAAQGITTFPDWWQPKLLAEVCCHALLCDLYPAHIERILINHLGKASLPALKALEKSEDIELQRQVFRLQQIIRGINSKTLEQVRESPNKPIIEELLGQGDLCAETYHELENELRTAHHRPYPNPTIIAVFGLYIKGYSRTEIAKTLGCSLENVRNYITVIYQHFELPAQRFQSREARKQKLIEVARKRGFIY